MRRHLFIPDTQVKPGVETHHLTWLGRYIKDKRPDVIVMGGDWYDMPSLSYYDEGKASGEGKLYAEDIRSGDKALAKLTKEFSRLRAYNPEMRFLLGNHENRIARYLNDNPKLRDTLNPVPEAIAENGFVVHGFLDPVYIDGICYSHFFPRGPNGDITQSKNGSTNAKVQLQRQMTSCTAGHRQGFDYATRPHPQGGQLHSIIAGSFYMHNETYKEPGGGNNHWQGVVMKHRVDQGDYDLCVVSLDYLEEKYG